MFSNLLLLRILWNGLAGLLQSVAAPERLGFRLKRGGGVPWLGSTRRPSLVDSAHLPPPGTRGLPMRTHRIPAWSLHWLAGIIFASALASPVAASVRLTDQVRPISQFIDLTLDAGQANYSGTVRIELNLAEALDTVRLHAQGPTVTEVKIQSVLSGDDDPRRPNPTHLWVLQAQQEDDGVLALKAPAALPAGDYRLTIDFDAPFGTQAVGLYRLEVEGKSYAFTQFEAVDARRAFPCFDEPAFKIPYQLQVTAPSGHEVVTNTETADFEEFGDGSVRRLFAKTKPLPPYLLAIATGPLESAPIPGLRVPGRIFTVAGKAKWTRTAAEITPAILDALEQKFGPYPFKKLDFIAVPEFWPGAMENPGAITYAENILVLDPETVSYEQRRWLAQVITHEISHQWFGNLVTMEWWDDLWLNEAFAYLIAARSTEEVFPELRTRLSAVTNTNRAMAIDALPSSYAIRKPVNTITSIMDFVSPLTNHKGKRVLWMVNDWIGEQHFLHGVQRYLRAHEWGNATGDDLWTALSEESGKDVAGVLTTFLDQPGIPLVTGVVMGNGELRLTQAPYAPFGVTPRHPNQLWTIPIKIRYGHGERVITKAVVLQERTLDIAFDLPGKPDWILLNADESGYYRWALTDEWFAALIERGIPKLTARERVALVEQCSALLESGKLRGDQYVELLAQFAEDREPHVVGAVLHGLRFVERAFVDADLREPFGRYTAQVLAPVMGAVGLEAAPREAPAIAMVRPRLVRWLGTRGGDTQVRAFADDLAARYLQDPTGIDPDLAGACLDVAAFHGNRARHDAYRQVFETTPFPAVRRQCLGALGWFATPELAKASLDYILTGPVRPQEVSTLLRALARQPERGDLLLDWASGRLDTIAGRVAPVSVPGLAYLFDRCDPELMARAQNAFRGRGHPALETQLERVSDSVEGCHQLRQREGASARAAIETIARAVATGG